MTENSGAHCNDRSVSRREEGTRGELWFYEEGKKNPMGKDKTVQFHDCVIRTGNEGEDEMSARME